MLPLEGICNADDYIEYFSISGFVLSHQDKTTHKNTSNHSANGFIKMICNISINFALFFIQKKWCDPYNHRLTIISQICKGQKIKLSFPKCYGLRFWSSQNSSDWGRRAEQCLTLPTPVPPFLPRSLKDGVREWVYLRKQGEFMLFYQLFDKICTIYSPFFQAIFPHSAANMQQSMEKERKIRKTLEWNRKNHVSYHKQIQQSTWSNRRVERGCVISTTNELDLVTHEWHHGNQSTTINN